MSLPLNQTFFDINSGYFLPTYTSSPHGLICGCDMCYDWTNLRPVNAIGPHDLHCVCYDCCAFALQDEAYNEAMRCRYPDLFEELEPYTPPPNSPTNEEMHAYNGNSSWSDFIYAAARGAAGSQNPADKFAAGSLGAAGLLGTSLLYTSAQNMAKPLSELRDQIFGPSNKEMHAYNGNWDSILSGFGLGPVPTKVSDYYDTPQKRKKDREFHKDVETLFPSLETEIRAHDLGGMGELLDKKSSGTNTRLRRKFTSPPLQPPKPEQVIHDITHHLQEKFPDIKGTPAMNIIHEELKQPEPNPQVIKDNLDKLAADHPEIRSVGLPRGPTNKEMHATNGNILHGPMNKNTSRKTHLNQLRRLKKKINRKKFLKKRGRVNINIKNGISKSRRLPRGVKRAAKVENEEKRIAMRYAAFLKDPVVPPPRLGSTGNNPTKIVHGYFKQTYLMSAPAMGQTPGLVNATSVLVSLYPKAFAYYGSRTNYSCPFVISFANADTVAFNDATNATLGAMNFTNNSNLANEVGSGAFGRFLGGHVSLECRCPMMNVAPPYIYGGVLPVAPAQSGSTPSLDPALYLTSLSGSAVRNLVQSDDVPGFEVSSVYVPDNPGALANDGFIFFIDSGAALVKSTATPYVGMVSCPTSASVTVTVSWWAELYQTNSNANYSGWRVGPKVSSEDVFDNLPRKIPAVKPKALTQGVKNISGFPAVLLEATKHQEPTQADRITQLEEKISRLQLLIEEEEDEKYVHTDAPPLSRSTIDLALQLKDRLTPGSVTSKTSRSSLP